MVISKNLQIWSSNALTRLPSTDPLFPSYLHIIWPVPFLSWFSYAFWRPASGNESSRSPTTVHLMVPSTYMLVGSCWSAELTPVNSCELILNDINMEVSWVIGVPPVIIHILWHFHAFSHRIQPSSYCGTPHFWKPPSYPPTSSKNIHKSPTNFP